jgi:hypothetical protein
MMSDCLFARFSGWMGHRGEIHNWVLRKTGPNIIDLVPHFRPKNQPLPPELPAAASKEGLLVAFPFHRAELPEKAFLDGVHLMRRGPLFLLSGWGLRCFNRFTGTSAGRATASLATT